METVILQWTYSPPDYFEKAIEIHRDDYEITIGNGKAETRMTDAVFDQDPSIRQALDNSLNSWFLGVQLLTHQPYTLSKSGMVRVDAQGRHNIFIGVESILSSCVVGAVDLQVTDKDGNIISDSRRDRIERKRDLAELVAKHRMSDSLLNALLSSYQAAVNDPDNELVHLYEIRDALAKKVGGGVREKLGIARKDWSRLGDLANDEPLRQGRHRGKSVGALRDATEGELQEARGIARHMIEAYLSFLSAASRAVAP